VRQADDPCEEDPMNGAEYVQSAFREMHRAMLADMQPLQQENLGWKPAPGANPIGAIFLHFMRTEDGIVHRLQEKPPMFESEGWAEKLGLADETPGSALNLDDADRVAQVPLERLLAYAERVMEDATEFVASLTDEGLDRAPDPNNPRRTVAFTLRSFTLSHGWWHLGEIKYLKGLQGYDS
jgi:hypothetical protein